MMAGLSNFTVETLLNQQIELIGPAAVSLDSLLRRRVSDPAFSPKLDGTGRPSARRVQPLLRESPRETHRHGHETAASLGLGGRGRRTLRTGDIMTHELLASLCRVSRCRFLTADPGLVSMLASPWLTCKSGSKDRAPPGGSDRPFGNINQT